MTWTQRVAMVTRPPGKHRDMLWPVEPDHRASSQSEGHASIDQLSIYEIPERERERDKDISI